ncbi:hypothetical protein G7085_07815 [Tessaracoccus sp. HDW20]|uniref:hypothetical protein n=1 Tax=Tessaracoccus coleopterorum TaxID=2714950 RepID=UPI0018D2FACF|nr:hypothetical protein [Tessaracoccus coleopterorum]
MSRAVVFGAGGIGRGFVGALFGSAGWRVTFVDVAEPLVARLAADGRYRQVVVRDDGETFVEIPGVDALLLGDEAAVVGALIDADIVATAVGAENLPPVARLLAAGLEARAGRVGPVGRARV